MYLPFKNQKNDKVTKQLQEQIVNVLGGAPNVSRVFQTPTQSSSLAKHSLLPVSPVQQSKTKIIGGDWGDCLDDSEIDLVLSRFEIPHLPARLFFDLKNNFTTKQHVLSLLRKKNGLIFPEHIRDLIKKQG